MREEEEEEEEPHPALTVTTVVAPSAVLDDRHPAQNVRTNPVSVA